MSEEIGSFIKNKDWEEVNRLAGRTVGIQNKAKGRWIGRTVTE